MSSSTVDLSKLTIEDIFRAKDERRRALAALPFDKKIEIVNKLRAATVLIKSEKLVFESFLKTYPNFAGESIKDWDVVEEWYGKRAHDPPPPPFSNRPDIIALTVSGKRIGIELKSWLIQQQIGEARRREKIQDNILAAIGRPQPPNETQSIGYVWLFPKQARFEVRDTEGFRNQLFRQIDEADNEMTRRPVFEQMSTHDIEQFRNFPLLAKYLHRIRLRPAARSRGTVRWIRFPDGSRHYSPREMLESLESSLLSLRSDRRYDEDLKEHVGLDEVYLLVHYDFKAFAYNTPFDAPGFGFNEAASFARESLNGDGGYFDRIFLFQFLLGKEEAYRIF
ncbi:MAG: hypothetical protein ACXW3C_02360 [Pyrinomonadaceae bacterium]